MKGLGIRWLCPDCGRVLDRPPYRVREDSPEVTHHGFEAGRYHAFDCRRPLVRCVVTLGGTDA